MRKALFLIAVFCLVSPFVTDAQTIKIKSAKVEGIFKVTAPVPSKKKMSIVVLRFNRRVKTAEAISKMYQNDLRPATEEELSAFVGEYPDVPKRYGIGIVALGSMGFVFNDDDELVATLCNVAKDDDIYATWCGREWNTSYRFAAVYNPIR